MMPEDKIEKKFQTLLDYLKVGAKIVRKIFTPDAFNYPFWAPVYERDEEITPTTTITYTDIKKGKFTIPDGIYPIVEIVQELNLAEYIRTGDKKKLERKVDFKINLGPEKGQEITLRWRPEITVVDDETDKSFIKNWEKVFGEEIFLLRSDIVLFLIVKNGALELRYFSMSKNNLVRYEKNEDNKIDLNYIWEEESVKYDRVKFAVDLLLEGDISTFGSTKIKQRYLLNRDFWSLMIDILWFNYDERNKMYWGMKEFVEKYWSKYMFKDRRTFLYINSIDWTKNKNLLKILEENKRLLDEIQTNPDKYPLTIPSPPNAYWVKYDDVLRSTSTRWETPTGNIYHSLGYGIYLITQYNINRKVKLWNEYKFTTNYIALLGNAETYVIYDIPEALVNYYKGLVDTGRRVGLVFSWSSPVHSKYLTFFYIHSPFNPYIEKDGALYIPDAISKLLLYDITELEPKIQKWIETQAQEDKKELDEMLEKILQEAKTGQFSDYTISQFDKTAEEKINKRDRIKIWEYEWEKLEKENQASSKKEEKKEKKRGKGGVVIEVYSGLKKTEHYIEETKQEEKISEIISESKEEKQQEIQEIVEIRDEERVKQEEEKEQKFVEKLRQEVEIHKEEKQKQLQAVEPEEKVEKEQEETTEKPKRRKKKEEISEVQQEEQKETTEKPKRKKKEEKIEVKTENKETTEEIETEKEEIKKQDILEELKDAEVEARVKSKVQVKLPEDMLEELISEKQEKKTTKRNKSRKSKDTGKKGKGKGKRRK
jgi:hypothetical protein